MPAERLLRALAEGIPPADPDLLAQITLGRELWLEPFRRRHLGYFLPAGGSKVKVLIGPEGTGKSHLLVSIAADAHAEGFATVYRSARDISRLGDLAALYRTVFEALDREELVQGLCARVVTALGYAHAYAGGALLPLLQERGIPLEDAKRDIREAISDEFRGADLSPAFATFVNQVARARLIHGSEEKVELLLKWASGVKLDRAEKGRSGQFEPLRKQTARAWLTSLINLSRLSGKKGLILLLDDLEILVDKSPITGKFAYTVAQAQDALELLRQVVDDAELLSHFALVVAGKPRMVEDPKRGFMSYEALWMRLQTGLVPSRQFNAHADLVDVAGHLGQLGPLFPEQVGEQIGATLERMGLRATASSPRPGKATLRDCVVHAARAYSAGGSL